MVKGIAKNIFIFLVLLLGFSPAVKADHIIGSDITYTSSDTAGIYYITFNFYRDCNGCYVLGQSPRCGTSENCNSSLTAPTSLTVYCKSSGSSIGNVSLSRTSIIDITPTCLTSRSRCAQPCNGSYPYGIEKHTFKGRADLRSNLNSCCEVEIGVQLYVRNVGITTGQSQQPFYTSCDINSCNDSINSSPALTNDPVAILCCNQPYTFNNGAVDTADFDSISYAFAPAYRAKSQLCTYSGTRTYLDPIATYYPGSLTFPYSNPNSSPPIGTYLNPETGDLIFTPTNCSEVAVVVIQMTEWRKDSTGTYKKVGVTRRDMQFIVTTCPDNNPPTIDGPYSYTVCEGSELCFNITTDDQVYTPPPPATAPAPDTVRVSWNRGIPGASFTVINPTARLQTGRFCWTPQIGQASDLPYTFTVTARDNACPLNAVTVRSFRVKVKPRAFAERDVDTLPCGVYAFDAIPAANFRGTPSYRWQILDSNLNIVTDRRVAKFYSSGAFISVSKQDTILFRRGGKYIIQHTINNSPQNCPTTYYDTLEVPPLLEANLSLGKDTFICAGTTLRLEPYINNASNPISYYWSTMGIENDGTIIDNASSQPGDTLSYFELTLPVNQYDTAISILVTDASGCFTEDTIQVFQKENPKATAPEDHRMCTYDSIKVLPQYDTAFWIEPTNGDTLKQGDTLYKQWFLNGSLIPFSIADSVTINIRGEYVIRVEDSLGCWDTDTFMLFVNDTVVADAGPDQVLCFGDSLILTAGGLDTVGNGNSGIYRWYDLTTNAPVKTNLGTATTLRMLADDDTEFELELYQTQGGVECFDNDSVFVDVNPLPILNMKPDFEVCCGDGNVSMNLNGLATGTPTTGSWAVPTEPGWVTGQTFHADSACALNSNIVKLIYSYQEPTTTCWNYDSINVTVNPLPVIEFKETRFCQDQNEFNLASALLRKPSAASINLGTPSWACVDCNGSDFNVMLEDRGAGGVPDYWLKIDEASYTIQNPQIDTVSLEFTYRNQYGCLERDTVDFEIWRVPKIKFQTGRDLCWDEGALDLNDLFDVNWDDGFWSMENLAGYRDSLNLGGITDSSLINTFNSVELSSPTANPNAFYLRYNHYATGCYAFNDTTLVINPLPDINITPIDAAYCDADSDVSLVATPGGSGGSWTTTVPSALVGSNTFSPSSVVTSDKNKDIWFFYTYQNPNTLCESVDSIRSFVEASPFIDILDDEIHACKPDGSNSIDIDIISTHSNVINPLQWSVVPLTGQSGTFSTTSDSSITATLTVSNDTSHRFFVSVSTGNGAQCPADDDIVFVNIHPVPDFTIAPVIPNGCNPVETDFIVTFNNQVLPDPVSAYNWDLGNGSSSSLDNPLALYDTDGPHTVTLTYTTDRGCSADATTNVDVYPIPVAAFTPDPNNFTTAALPRFSFDDQSTVDPVLGSTINSWFWDFNSIDAAPPTSTDQNPTTFYNTDTATYNVKLVVTTNYGCSDSTYRKVVIGPDLIVYTPTAFTPNKSGPEVNDKFKSIISGEKSMELIIFNRWGEIMFQTTDKNEEWDGTFRGAPCQQDVYAYQMRVVALNDEVYTYSGTITLIR